MSKKKLEITGGSKSVLPSMKQPDLSVLDRLFDGIAQATQEIYEGQDEGVIQPGFEIRNTIIDLTEETINKDFLEHTVGCSFSSYDNLLETSFFEPSVAAWYRINSKAITDEDKKTWYAVLDERKYNAAFSPVFELEGGQTYSIQIVGGEATKSFRDDNIEYNLYLFINEKYDSANKKYVDGADENVDNRSLRLLAATDTGHLYITAPNNTVSNKYTILCYGITGNIKTNNQKIPVSMAGEINENSGTGYVFNTNKPYIIGNNNTISGIDNTIKLINFNTSEEEIMKKRLEDAREIIASETPNYKLFVDDVREMNTNDVLPFPYTQDRAIRIVFEKPKWANDAEKIKKVRDLLVIERDEAALNWNTPKVWEPIIWLRLVKVRDFEEEVHYKNKKTKKIYITNKKNSLIKTIKCNNNSKKDLYRGHFGIEDWQIPKDTSVEEFKHLHRIWLGWFPFIELNDNNELDFNLGPFTISREKVILADNRLKADGDLAVHERYKPKSKYNSIWKNPNESSIEERGSQLLSQMFYDCALLSSKGFKEEKFVKVSFAYYRGTPNKAKKREIISDFNSKKIIKIDRNLSLPYFYNGTGIIETNNYIPFWRNRLYDNYSLVNLEEAYELNSKIGKILKVLNIEDNKLLIYTTLNETMEYQSVYYNNSVIKTSIEHGKTITAFPNLNENNRCIFIGLKYTKDPSLNIDNSDFMMYRVLE